ncbi:LysR family transcriptional regulator [Mesorhizobium australicum]|uniref:LysR family transcriptional regulator n=1 Tax=Mesorhizobium australicum TaxID=536018 RepID=UPI00333BBB2D
MSSSFDNGDNSHARPTKLQDSTIATTLSWSGESGAVSTNPIMPAAIFGTPSSAKKGFTEAGGFSAAQIVLNVSQSTISTQMAELESRLGLKLCRRGRSGFSLTDDGHATYEAAKNLFRGCDDFLSNVNERRGSVSGELRIALADSLVGNPDFPIEEILGKLSLLMPKVTISLSQADPLTIERQVLDQRTHAGIHNFPNRAPGLRYLRLFSELQTLYCGRAHPLFERDDAGIDESEINRHQYASRSYYGGSLKSGLSQSQSVNVQATSMEGIVAFILSGKFVGHLPPQSAQHWLDSGLIRAILPQRFSYTTRFECVLSAGMRVSRAVDIFEQVLESYYPQGA